MADKKQTHIKICDAHDGYPTPLLWTFAFVGAEYWCPHCGHSGGMMGAGEDVEITDELKNRAKKFRKLTQHEFGFLRAKGITHCAGTEWNGKAVTYPELSQEVKDAFEKVRNDWSYEREIEKIDVAAEIKKIEELFAPYLEES